MSKARQGKISGGKDVMIYLLPAGEGLSMATKLMKAFAPSIASVLGDYQSEEGFDFMVLSYTVVEGLDKVEIETIVKRLLKECAIDGRQVDFEDYFMANYAELIEVLTFALRENFESFLALKGFVEKYIPMQKNEQSEVE